MINLMMHSRDELSVIAGKAIHPEKVRNAMFLEELERLHRQERVASRPVRLVTRIRLAFSRA